MSRPPPPPGSPPPDDPEDDLGSPPGTPPDMDPPDFGPEDDIPPDDLPEDLPDDLPEDMPEDLPEDGPDDGPPPPDDMPEDLDGPPDDLPEDDEMPDDVPGDLPEDGPEDGPEELPPIPEDEEPPVDLPDDDAPPPDDAPPDSAPDEDLPPPDAPIDDEGPPADAPPESRPDSPPPPSEDSASSRVERVGLRLPDVAGGASLLKTTVRPRQSNSSIPLTTKPLVRQASNLAPDAEAGIDSLSAGLSLNKTPQLLMSKRLSSTHGRSAKMGDELGLAEFQKRRQDSESIVSTEASIPEQSEPSDEVSVTPSMKSTGTASRVKLQRKQRAGHAPAKLRNAAKFDEVVGLNEESAKKPEPAREFFALQGRFDDDAFEPLEVAVDGSTLYIRTPVAPELIPFDLNECKIAVDSNNSCVFLLHQPDSVVTFKAESASIVSEILAQLPESAFESAIQEKSTHSDKENASENEPEPVQPTLTESVQPFGPEKSFDGLKYSDLTLEDMLTDHDFLRSEIEGYDAYTSFAQFEKDKYSSKDDSVSSTPAPKKLSRGVSKAIGKTHLKEDITPINFGISVKGYHRKELIDSKLQKPKYSVRRVKQLCQWVSTMHIWPRPILILNLHTEMCSGLLLARIMQVVVPQCQFMHLNEKALSKKAALENLEQALGVIWRSKCVNNSRIPTSEEIFNGNTAKIAILLQEVFEVYVRKPLYHIAPKMFKWYNSILRQYSVPIPDIIFTEGDLSCIWPHFQSGTCLFCVIYHLYGPVIVGEGANAVKIDPLRIVSEPANIVDFRSNISYLFSLLRALNIEVLWDLEDWISYPDTEFIVLQLYYLYNALKMRQCSLPPAQGTNAGVTSGPNGEPMVSGMVYADTRPVNSRAFQRKKRTVLLGTGEDSLPVLPIDTSGDTEGRFRHTCPAGLLSNKVKIQFTNVEVKGQRATTERKDWNPSCVSDRVEEQLYGCRQLDILRGKDAATIDVLQRTHASFDSPLVPEKPVSKPLTEAMEELEKAMLDSQREMNELEDDLANRYIELEGMVTKYTVQEYNHRLNQLEKERLLLEEERCRLQEHFALRLSSIRAQYEESSLRVKPSKSTPAKSLPSPSPRKQSTEKLKQAERGWNQHCGKKQSFNYVLGKAAASNSISFEGATLKTGSKVQDALGAKLSVAIAQTADDVDTQWSNFKNRLADESKRWAQSRRDRQSNKMNELLSFRTDASVESTRIPVTPIKTSSATSYEGDEMLRRDELRAMQLEEARRYMVLQEQLSSYGDSTPALARSSSNVSKGPKLPSPKTRAAKTPKKQSAAVSWSSATPAPRPTDIDAAVSWLSFPRPLLLLDRHTKKEFVFSVDTEYLEGSQVFVLSWMENDARKGYVYLKDVANISVASNPSILVLTLATSARALKTTAGRTVLLLNFSSEAECGKFRSALDTVMRSA